MWLLVRDGRARRWRVHATSHVVNGYVYGLASTLRMRNVGASIKSDARDEAVRLALRCLCVKGGVRTCAGQTQPVLRARAKCRRRVGLPSHFVVRYAPRAIQGKER